jgi:hypothetical protein
MNGHWIFTVRRYSDKTLLGECWRCSKCGCASFDNYRFPSHELFCHGCGTAMTEDPVLEVKEVEYKPEYSWE